jgi:hypothetical protein
MPTPKVELVINPTSPSGSQAVVEMRKLVQDELQKALSKALSEHTKCIADLNKSVRRMIEASKAEGQIAKLTPTSKGGSPNARQSDGGVSEVQALDCEKSMATQKIVQASLLLQPGDVDVLLGQPVEKPNIDQIADMLVESTPRCSRCIRSIAGIYSHWGVHEVKNAGGPISRFVDSNLFRRAVDILILCNCVFMWLAADSEVSSAGSSTAEFVVWGERIFLIAYSFEFLFKMVRFRWEYFVGPEWRYNWLDFFLLCLGYFFQFSETGSNLGFLRTIRILKLAKALRVFRLVAAFKSLRAILVSVINTIGTLGWSILMLGVIHFIFALVIVLQVAGYLSDGDVDAAERERLLFWFGSVFKGMLALYGTHSGAEGWQTFYYLFEPIGWHMQSFLIFFMFFSQIAILNIILGIFVDDAMKCMESSKEEAILEHAAEQREIAERLTALCKETDEDDTGKISKEEWKKAIERGSMQSYLDLIGFKIGNVITLFDVMLAQSEDGSVSIHDFVHCCLRMKGPSTDFDMRLVINRLDQISKNIVKSSL